jgi:NAD dependent epimerase/dehydratase family enzyme
MVENSKKSTKKPTFISTSAVGYFPSDQWEKKFTEDDIEPAKDEIGDLCKEIESCIPQKNENLRNVIIRPGVVLSRGSFFFLTFQTEALTSK